MDARSTLLPGPGVILPLELELFATVGEVRLRLALLDRDHESRENHSTQNSRCKPPSITIESLITSLVTGALPCVRISIF